MIGLFPVHAGNMLGILVAGYSQYWNTYINTMKHLPIYVHILCLYIWGFLKIGDPQSRGFQY